MHRFVLVVWLDETSIGNHQDQWATITAVTLNPGLISVSPPNYFRAIGSLIEARRNVSAFSLPGHRLIVLLTNEQLDYKVRPDNLSSMTSELELSFGSRESKPAGRKKGFSR